MARVGVSFCVMVVGVVSFSKNVVLVFEERHHGQHYRKLL